MKSLRTVDKLISDFLVKSTETIMQLRCDCSRLQKIFQNLTSAYSPSQKSFGFILEREQYNMNAKITSKFQELYSNYTKANNQMLKVIIEFYL